MGRVEINPFVHFPFLKAYNRRANKQNLKAACTWRYPCLNTIEFERMIATFLALKLPHSKKKSSLLHYTEIAETPHKYEPRVVIYTPRWSPPHLSSAGGHPKFFSSHFFIIILYENPALFFLPPSSWGVGYYSRNKMKLCASLVMYKNTIFVIDVLSLLLYMDINNWQQCVSLVHKTADFETVHPCAHLIGLLKSQTAVSVRSWFNGCVHVTNKFWLHFDRSGGLS